MIGQQTLDELFAASEPPHNGTLTSIRAARRVRPYLNGLRAQVYEFIKAQGLKGATRQEVADGTGIPIQTICPRFCELIKPPHGDPLICKNGAERDGGDVFIVTGPAHA